MPTHQDETLQQRYGRENQDYLKLCGSMTAEQVADLQLQLNNALAREQALQQRLTAADERVDVLEMVLQVVRKTLGLEVWDQWAGLNETRDLIDAALKPAEGSGDDKRKAEFIRINSAPHCPECGHPDCNGQCYCDDMMGD